MNSAELLLPHVHRAARRFAVAWRNRVQRSIHDVAVLDVQGGTYRFQYLAGVGESLAGFRPFIGFPDLERIYESSRLWPFFDLRVMDRKRPDFTLYTSWLGLTPGADRLDILSRSGGEQKGDTVSLAESPHVADDGATDAVFLLRGASYAIGVYDSVAEAELVQPGDQLGVLDDVTNEANPDALLLTANGKPIGWVPDLLIEYAREVATSGAIFRVLRNNGPSSPWHMRLLVQVSGRVTPGWSAFTGSRWPPLPEWPPA